MLDIIPYVSVTVKVHVLLFKPRVGAKLGARRPFAHGRRSDDARKPCGGTRRPALRHRSRAVVAPSCAPRARRPLRGARARRATRTPPAPALSHAR
jgi:hypothetical protein